ncbi:pyridoxal-phosphate dependent enzyme [Actinosynnema sp. NPDC047251]|uniref:Pyridoxal-5'-phosphate-dependent protein, beta subunit n=1 Tax=Saccharothrix espanaensis (strain ATCC 51144 / DSM 44229 / JCM 9112 / NBRC 15066 / NRRL 15764) TaxID=1179773 RepID=K0JUD6_SACES|nr:pyridoxal-phosphate dependent enzyme [Saccharothrix espanaensis]CCH27858.1 Pyridoxal-5'-phosphate-dependent protein, beta subunit [Saccharothrix espanaensis DSM 44229]
MDLDLENIARAAKIIDPVFRDSPQYVDEQLCAELDRRILVKVETTNPLRSFKGRGADFLATSLTAAHPVVCASAGNFGQALAYAGRTHGFPVEVFASAQAIPAKITRMRSLGATVHQIEGDFTGAKDTARRHAERTGAIFIEDGKDPAISEGAGSIAVELLTAGLALDAAVLPVGDGALITGMARWLKEHSPSTKIIGVCAQGAPVLAHAWAGRTHTGPVDTIAVRVPVPEAVTRLKALVDDIVLVDDDAIRRAADTALHTLGLVLEPAGAAGLAAIAAHDIPGETIATVLTGSNV